MMISLWQHAKQGSLRLDPRAELVGRCGVFQMLLRNVIGGTARVACCVGRQAAAVAVVTPKIHPHLSFVKIYLYRRRLTHSYLTCILPAKKYSPRQSRARQIAASFHIQHQPRRPKRKGGLCLPALCGYEGSLLRAHISPELHAAATPLQPSETVTQSRPWPHQTFPPS